MNKIKPCPFCSSKCTSPHSGLVSCSKCNYWGATIAAHNRAAGAVELVRDLSAKHPEDMPEPRRSAPSVSGVVVWAAFIAVCNEAREIMEES